jgi:hypothetical protein
MAIMQGPKYRFRITEIRGKRYMTAGYARTLESARAKAEKSRIQAAEGYNWRGCPDPIRYVVEELGERGKYYPVSDEDR